MQSLAWQSLHFPSIDPSLKFCNCNFRGCGTHVLFRRLFGRSGKTKKEMLWTEFSKASGGRAPGKKSVSRVRIHMDHFPSKRRHILRQIFEGPLGASSSGCIHMLALTGRLGLRLTVLLSSRAVIDKEGDVRCRNLQSLPSSSSSSKSRVIFSAPQVLNKPREVSVS